MIKGGREGEEGVREGVEGDDRGWKGIGIFR